MLPTVAMLTNQKCRRVARLLPLALLAQPNGENVYKARCAGCHDQTSDRIPPRVALQKMPSARILRVLDAGDCDLIVVESPPDGTAWDGVRDRLSRAAGHSSDWS